VSAIIDGIEFAWGDDGKGNATVKAALQPGWEWRFQRDKAVLLVDEDGEAYGVAVDRSAVYAHRRGERGGPDRFDTRDPRPFPGGKP